MERKRKIKEYIKYFLFLAAFLLLFSSRVSAAQDQDYFPIEQNKNGHFTDNSISAIANYFDDENNYIVVYYFDYNYRAIVFPKTDYSNNLGQLCGEKYTNLYQFSLYQLGSLNIQTYQFQLYNGSQIINLVNFGSNSWGYWQGLPSSNYDTSKDYISNLRVWTTNNSSKKLVINYEEEPIWDDQNNDTYPQNADEPNIDDYIPSNEPGFDNTDSMSALQSIWNWLSWFGGLIKGLFDYVVNSLNWGLQKVINSIRNAINGLLTGIQTAISNAVTTITGFLSDIQDFVEDLQEKVTDLVDYITNPWDEEEFETQMENSDFFGAIDTIQTNFETFYNTMDAVEERDHFSLHYTTGFHPDIEVGGNRVPTIEGEISFDWLYPLRTIYRPILWVVCLYEMFVYGSATLSKAIGGK